MSLRTHVEFRSDKFPAYPGEEEEVNPDLWGKRLAEYLFERLPLEGVKTVEIYSEDWGWAVSIAHEGVPVWIGCGRYQEYDDGYLLFIEPSKPMVRKGFFKKVDMTPVITQLSEALDKILRTDAEIRSVRWWEEDKG